MKFSYFSTIRRKLLGIVATTVLIALTFSFIGNVAGDVWAYRSNLVAEMNEQAMLLQRVAATALAQSDARQADSSLKALSVQPKIQAAAIYDQQGRLFASYAPPAYASQIPRILAAPLAGMRDNKLVVLTPIQEGGHLAGTVFVQARYDLTDTIVQDFKIGAAVTLGALLIAMLMIARLEKIVTQPVIQIAAAARDVIAGGDYSRRVNKSSDDEAGMMVDSFNNMLAKVQRHMEELEVSHREVIGEAQERKRIQLELMELNADLEQRVLDRTAALKQLNGELLAASEAANMASHAKSNFLASMSHEIRTPMNGVIGMLDVLHQTSLSGYQVEMVELIRESGYSLLTIIDDILDFSKIEAGKLDIDETCISLANVTENACGMLDHLAGKKGVELRMFIDPSMPDAVMGDGARIRQIVVNLVSNAIKFSSGGQRAGRTSVRLMLAASTTDNVEVELRVTDNGIGMDKATMDRLFSAFTQGDTSTTRRFGGTGLGLVITKRLVDLMGGTLAMDSALDQGATFIVRLPFRPTNPAELTFAPLSDISKLSCLVVGPREDVAGDAADYLSGICACLELAEDLEQAYAMTPAEYPAPWVWIIDAPDGELPFEALCEHAKAVGHAGLRFVMMGRGLRRSLLPTHRDFVSVDGNVLTRRSLVSAIAAAAGLGGGKTSVAPVDNGDAALLPPHRDEALSDGRLILVAEDNETNQKVIRHQLNLLGYAVDIASNGRLALAMWRNHEYGLLLSDLHMPEMDGYELAATIRTMEQERRRMPILALTANIIAGEADRCLAAGMDGYLSKPLPLASLKLALEKWMPASAATVSAATTIASKLEQRTEGPVDIRVLQRLIGDEADILLEVLTDFQQSAADISNDLRKAYTAGDMTAAGNHAHKLKSSAGSVGALTLADICTRIETVGKHDNIGLPLDLLMEFDHEMEAVEKYLAATLPPKLDTGA